MIRWTYILLFLTALDCAFSFSQVSNHAVVMPEQFVIGRRTFFDFGPPFDFYEVFLVHSTAEGTSVQRLTVTPRGDACTQPATVQSASVVINESISTLLGNKNPCTIPEKDVRKELKRCKKCLVFSGANVTMQVQCGEKTRRIRMDILDRDMFDQSPNTPEHTSWTFGLLGRLDQAAGPGVMQQPTFKPYDPTASALGGAKPEVLDDLRKGTFDILFEGAPQKPSELFIEAQNVPREPDVLLVGSSPFSPESPILPKYPPIARAAHVEGSVAFKFDVTPNGDTSNLTFISGHPFLKNAVELAVASWKFPKEAAGTNIQTVIDFKMNCLRAQP